jgi:hypothetical protein
MDIYGFKLVDLFIPPITHHSTSLAKFGLEHRQASVLNDEEGSGYLGLLGIGCLLFLVGTAVRAMVEGRATTRKTLLLTVVLEAARRRAAH